MTRLAAGMCGVAALAATLGPLACGSDEAPGTPGVARADAGEVEGQDAGARIRTVALRARFGALDPTNLLLDGGFEYSGMDLRQYPWFGVDYTFIVTGARCRSGLRCVEIPLAQTIIGVFVWPDAGSVDIEYFAKPSGSGDCLKDVGGLVMPLEDYSGAPAPTQVSPTVAERDADGWCHVTSNVPVPADTGNTFWGLVLSSRQRATGSVLVDDASVRAANGGSTRRVLSAPSELETLARRARGELARRRPVPPRAEPVLVNNRTGRRQR